jgi:hypothetical protein
VACGDEYVNDLEGAEDRAWRIAADRSEDLRAFVPNPRVFDGVFGVYLSGVGWTNALR